MAIRKPGMYFYDERMVFIDIGNMFVTYFIFNKIKLLQYFFDPVPILRVS